MGERGRNKGKGEGREEREGNRETTLHRYIWQKQKYCRRQQQHDMYVY